MWEGREVEERGEGGNWREGQGKEEKHQQKRKKDVGFGGGKREKDSGGRGGGGWWGWGGWRDRRLEVEWKRLFGVES